MVVMQGGGRRSDMGKGEQVELRPAVQRGQRASLTGSSWEETGGGCGTGSEGVEGNTFLMEGQPVQRPWAYEQVWCTFEDQPAGLQGGGEQALKREVAT